MLFTNLPSPGDSEGTFRSSSRAVTCPMPICLIHTHTVNLIAEQQLEQEICEYQFSVAKNKHNFMMSAGKLL